MLKYFSVAVVFASLIAIAGPANAVDEKVVQKCRKQVKKIVPSLSTPADKKYAGSLMKKCINNGGKL